MFCPRCSNDTKVLSTTWVIKVIRCIRLGKLFDILAFYLLKLLYSTLFKGYSQYCSIFSILQKNFDVKTCLLFLTDISCAIFDVFLSHMTDHCGRKITRHRNCIHAHGTVFFIGQKLKVILVKCRMQTDCMH